MRSPLFSGFVYIVLGVVFFVFAIQQVLVNDWYFFVYILLIFATFDLGAGFRLIALHFKMKKQHKK